MSTPAENQKTVEAALRLLYSTRRRDEALAALRDLVAQAELAEELGEALRESFTYWHATPEQFLEFPPEHDRVKRIMDTLTRLDGAR